MVWQLIALNSDESISYSFVSPGTYRIGRKDCAVCIPTDKTISRLHAELVVHPLSAADYSPENAKCKATLRDLSKFGTFVNKRAGSKPVLQLPSKETVVRDRDEITFGTLNSVFRVTYVHFFFCVSAPQCDSVAAKTRSNLGAYSVQTWNPECTHVLVEDGSPVTELVLMAACHRKPVVSLHWLEAVIAASSSPAGDIPKSSGFVPTMKLPLDNSLVKVVDPETRQSMFKNVIFLVSSLHQYFCKENLKSLVSAGGGALELVSKFKDSKMHQILIVPDGAVEANVRKEFRGFHHIQRIKESSLVLAILSGCKDRSAFFTASDESQSSDATVDLQDSGDDADSGANTAETEPKKSAHVTLKHSEEMETTRVEPKAEANADRFQTKAQTRTSFTCKDEETGSEEYGEVDFVVGLVVRRDQQPSLAAALSTTGGPNFKRFQRVGAVAGNSFHSFVPFDSVPYGETAYFGELEERMKQDKKRAAEDKLADELFRRDDLKRRKTAKGESLAILKESSSKRKK